MHTPYIERGRNGGVPLMATAHANWPSTSVLAGAFSPYREQPVLAALLDAIPGARLVVYEGAGHALHWEQPGRYAADLAAFAEAAVKR